MGLDERTPRQATADDAEEIARLLHDFNSEFETPSPGTGVLAARLRVLLAGDETVAILAGRPAVAMALITVRPNVWYAGMVALLDELYVVPRLRGQGFGSAIMDQLVSMARARGVNLIEINVDEGDLDALFAGRTFAAKAPVPPSGARGERRLCPVDGERSVQAVRWTGTHLPGNQERWGGYSPVVK